MYQPFTYIYLPSNLHAYTFLYLFIPTSAIYILLGRSPRWSWNLCSFRIESIMASNGWCGNDHCFNLAQVIYPRHWSQFPIQNFMFSLNNNGLDVTCYTNRKIFHTFGLKYKVILVKLNPLIWSMTFKNQENFDTKESNEVLHWVLLQNSR